MTKVFRLILILTIVYSPNLFGQAKTGNIVEYLGKQRFEKTEEGEVIYNFTEGYSIPYSTENGYLFTTGDGVAWEIFSDNFKEPSKDNNKVTNYGRKKGELSSSAITADSTGVFRSKTPRRRSYVYSKYDSPKKQVVLLETTGSTRVFVNKLPHEGDLYDFGYTLIPFVAKKGENQFLFTPGRFGSVKAKIVVPDKPIMFTKRDVTLPNIIIGENDEKWGAIRVINATSNKVDDLIVECVLSSGEKTEYKTSSILDMNVRKVPFLIPAVKATEEKTVEAVLYLKDSNNKVLDQTSFNLQVKKPSTVIERTFRSSVDGSVQYFSVNPSSIKADSQALVLSVHGASVEASGQARVYGQKDWAHVVAPTNRRPYGFNWEEWGRIDAMEVFDIAKKLYKTDPQRSYLTGHSMGGHGTWHLGVTYPDQFAAIAPCASYPDIAGYSRMNPDSLNALNPNYEMFKRGANGGRTLDLKRNYLQSGIYVLHGNADNVVPVIQVRRMREELAKFHPDFCYYEYPGGSHWYGNHCVDWAPIFDYFKWHKIPQKKDVKAIEFYTASPAISASNYWLTIEQQIEPYNFSNVDLKIVNDTLRGTTNNVAALKLDLTSMPLEKKLIIDIDGDIIDNISVDNLKELILVKNGKWNPGGDLSAQKNSLRSGGFKQAFTNNVIFVYPTGGSKEETEWYKNKARFDAETFLYKANGSIDIISDSEYIKNSDQDRSVIIYGNNKINKAWSLLLKDSPIQVSPTAIKVGDKSYNGDDLGAYFLYPKKNSNISYVGVVAGTGLKGAYSIFPNDYISGITGYPDYAVFNLDILKDGLGGVLTSGFLDNNWNVVK